MSQSSACLSDDLLMALAEERLPAGERADADAHLAQCAACRTNLAWIKQHLLSQLDSNGEPAPASPDELELTDQRDVPTRTYSGEESAVSLPVNAQKRVGKQGEYELVRVLGRGGYGVVFEARDTLLHRPVAIKMLKRDLANRETSRRRFIREARAGAAINHPNVVTIHGVDEAGAIPFLIMELICGDTLRERIRREPKLEIIDVIRISAQIAQGLAAAHAQGIIHRDVKPGNIMLVDDLPRVKITDFGLARVTVEDIEFTSRGLAVGTPAYMSPEQVRGEEIDTRSDLFALGCVMYAMITGHSPYFGQNALEVARRIDGVVPPRLVDVDKRVPEFLSAIVERLLQKDRDRRYQSAAEVADVLNRHLAMLNQTPTDKLPAALRAPLVEVEQRERPSARAVGASILAVIALLAAAVAFQYWGDGRTARSGDAGRSANPGAAVPAARMAEVTVDQAGAGDATTIGAALGLVAPGGLIAIRDAAEYHERIELADPQAFAGVRIVAADGAVLRSAGRQPIVMIRDVPRVELRGLRIIARQLQPGIEVRGACPGLTIEDLTIERIDNEDGSSTSNSGLNLRYGAAGTAAEPIVVRRTKLLDTNVGIVIGNPATAQGTTGHIVVEDCRVVGHSNSGSTLLVLQRGCEHVVVRQSIFARGGMGLSLLADEDDEEAVPRRCEISHNTWHDVRSWIVWAGPQPTPATLRIHDNLIVDSEMIADAARSLASGPSEAAVFQNNVVFNPDGASGEFDPAATAVASFPLLSLDPAHSAYLKPDFARLHAENGSSGAIPGRYSGPDASE